MRSLISRVVSVVRPWPLMAYTALTALVVVSMASPASAAPVNGCTTTDAVRPLSNLIVDNVVNPVKTYGWKAVAVIAVIAVGAAMFGSSRNGFWKAVGWGIALMVVIVPLVGHLAGAHSGPC